MEVIPLEQYPDYLLGKSVGELLKYRLKIETAEQRRLGQEGLIPNIYIPVKFPTAVKGLIGEGGELRISGGERIEFGGSTTQEVNPKETETYQRSLLPQLEMEQQLRVNLEGTVGQKIHVFIDHDSQREFDIKNTIRLQYRGDEDEVIKEINAGNTDISLPGGIIGAPRSNKGLFGIKVLGELGPIDFTAIASKEESETESKSLVGGAIEDSTILWDTEFITDRFFHLRYFVGEGDSILTIRLYVSTNESDDTRPGNAIDYETITQIRDTTPGHFKFLEQGDDKDFVLYGEERVLDIEPRIGSQGTIGFFLVYENSLGVVDTIGDDISEPITLRILKRTKMDKDPKYMSWDYEIRNIYPLPGANIDEQTFEMKIFKDNLGTGRDSEFVSGDTTYLAYLDMAKEDGTVNLNYVYPDRGIIQFPSAEPFLELPDPDSIYNIPRIIETDAGKKYYIWMKYKGIQKRYSLGLNVLEGSDRIVMDGQVLQRGIDYEINYEFGELTFKEGVITNPDAKIDIDYQYVPFMQTASKNLLGARINYDRGGNLKFGSTFIYHSSSSFDKRPKLGSEPKRIILGALNGTYQVNPSFLTNMVNLVPFVNTDAQSSFDLRFETGFSMPNPNTKGEVYIDDMEGVRTSTSLGITRTRWSFGSQPPDRSLNDFETLHWYNPKDGVNREDIIPDLPEHRRKEKQSILHIECKGKWGSLLTLVSQDGADFEKSEFIETWIRGDGIVHIDIGKNIPEEALYRDREGNIKRNETIYPRTEDKNGNRRLDIGEGEDTGLDTIPGDDDDWTPGSADDGNDDCTYTTDNPYDYSTINGTEKNGRLDTEDLNGDGVVNQNDDYFSFKIDLSSDEHLVQEGNNGWRLYRIPLSEANTVGSSKWTYIRYARLWIEGPDTVEIATMEVVGNRWEKKGDIELAVRDNQENRGTPPYDPPYKPETDDYGREEKEASLSMVVTDGGSGSAYTLYGTPRTFIQYKTLTLYIKGINVDGKFFIRIGGDTLTYYEYRVDIPDSWRELKIPLDSITHLKIERDTLPSDSIFGRNIGQDSCFVLGDPSLTSIKRVEIGILPADADVKGEVWVDDIRLKDTKRNIGVAGSVSGGVKFADLMNIGFSYARSDPYFRKFGQEMVPQGGFSNSYNLSFSSGLDKFLPSSSGISIPINGGMGKTVSLPMYATNSDIVLTESESKEQKTISQSRNISLSFSKSGSQNKILEWTLDKISMNANYSDNSSRGPEKVDSVETVSLRLGYGLSPALPKIKILGMDIAYYPDNFNINSDYHSRQTRSYDIRGDSVVLVKNPHTITRSDNGSISFSPLPSLRSRYNIASSNDLNFKREVSRGEGFAVSFSPKIWHITTQKVSYTSNYSENFPVEKVDIIDGDTLPVRDVGNANAIDFEFGISLEETGKKLPFLKGFLTLFTSPGLCYSISRSISLYSLIERPKREFIFGFSSDPGVKRIRKSNNSESEKTSISVTSGFRWRIISLSYRYSDGQEWGGTADNKTWSSNRTLPDISFSLKSLEKIWRLSEVLTGLSISSSFRVYETSSGQRVGEANNISRNTSLGPSLNMQWKKDISSRFFSSFSNNYTKTSQGGNSFSEKEEKHFDMGISGGYKFTAPEGIKLPGLTKIKFEGNLDTNVEIKYSRDWGRNITKDTKSRDRYTLSLSPGLSYNFASNITGGGRIDFSETNDIMTDMHTRSLGARVWADFRF